MVRDDPAARLLAALERRDGKSLRRTLSRHVHMVLDSGDASGGFFRGRKQVSTAMMGLCWSTAEHSVTPTEVNGRPGALLQDPHGRVVGVLGFGLSRRSITDIWALTAPDKIARWRARR